MKNLQLTLCFMGKAGRFSPQWEKDKGACCSFPVSVLLAPAGAVA